jgi:hypothetical protein
MAVRWILEGFIWEKEKAIMQNKSLLARCDASEWTCPLQPFRLTSSGGCQRGAVLEDGKEVALSYAQYEASRGLRAHLSTAMAAGK